MWTPDWPERKRGSQRRAPVPDLVPAWKSAPVPRSLLRPRRSCVRLGPCAAARDRAKVGPDVADAICRRRPRHLHPVTDLARHHEIGAAQRLADDGARQGGRLVHGGGGRAHLERDGDGLRGKRRHAQAEPDDHCGSMATHRNVPPGAGRQTKLAAARRFCHRPTRALARSGLKRPRSGLRAKGVLPDAWDKAAYAVGQLKPRTFRSLVSVSDESGADARPEFATELVASGLMKHFPNQEPTEEEWTAYMNGVFKTVLEGWEHAVKAVHCGPDVRSHARTTTTARQSPDTPIRPGTRFPRMA